MLKHYIIVIIIIIIITNIIIIKMSGASPVCETRHLLVNRATPRCIYAIAIGKEVQEATND